jgi:hypothetical protein
MSDVIWAAIIAVAGSGITGGITARATYWVARRTSDTAIATADKQGEVELAKVQGELDRLREEQRQAERSNRQGTYHLLLQAMNRLDMYGTGYPLARGRDFEADTDAAVEQLNGLISGVQLFGPPDVQERLKPLTRELELFGGRLADRRAGRPSEPYEASFAAAWRARREQTMAAERELIEAMNADVTREIL